MPRHQTINIEQPEQTDPTATDLIGRAVRIQQLLQSLSSFFYRILENSNDTGNSD